MLKIDTDLLSSYANGPRIWDAAEIVPVVHRLADAGLIAPVGNDGAYALTEQGRAKLNDTTA